MSPAGGSSRIGAPAAIPDRAVLLQGRLSAHPARQLLRGLLGSGRSGTVVFARRDAAAAVVLRDGELAYAVSDDPTRRLLVKLFERGVLSEKQCARLADQCSSGTLRMPVSVLVREQRGIDLAVVRGALMEVAADQLHGVLGLMEAHYRLEHREELHIAAGCVRRAGLMSALAARARVDVLRPGGGSPVSEAYDVEHQFLDLAEVAWPAARRDALFAALPGLHNNGLLLLRRADGLFAVARRGFDGVADQLLPIESGSTFANVLTSGQAGSLAAARDRSLILRLGVMTALVVPVRCASQIAGLLVVECGRRELDAGAIEASVREVSLGADRDLRSEWERRLDSVFARLRDFYFAFAVDPAGRGADPSAAAGQDGSAPGVQRPISFRLPF